MDEVMSNLKHWSIRHNLPKEVKQQLTEKILPLNGEERFQEMLKIQWREFAYKKGKEKVFWTRYFMKKSCSVYEPLLRTLIEKAKDAKELISIASICGVDMRLDDEKQRR